MAWKEFKRGKSKKKDVQKFRSNLGENISNLYNELKNKTYRHSDYFSFYIKDPKLRHIHKACVKDRVLHHAVFRILYPIFDELFIFDSYSCRNKKGTHRAIKRLNEFLNKESKNNSRNCFILKCDIKKYFDSISQDILLNFIEDKIEDKQTIWLVSKIIASFPKGIPLGNITSQLFANIYLNKLDKYVKHKLKIKYYIRYCDDFVIISRNKNYLEKLVILIDNFLRNNLKLFLHPNKISIKKYHQGIDFLGYVSFPYFKILRIKTKNRIVRKLENKELELKDCIITKKCFNQTIKSYLEVLKHCDSHKIRRNIFNKFFGMIYFLYGQDSFRSKQKLNEIIEHYKEVHKSGLNLIFIDAKEKSFSDFSDGLKVVSMFAEKKLIIIKNVFSLKSGQASRWQEEFLKEIDNLKSIKDIIVIYESDKVDERSKLFKILKKEGKCQEFNLLGPAVLKKWVDKEFEKYGSKIDPLAKELLLAYSGDNLWQMANEIKKLSDYKKSGIVKKEDIELHIRPKIENDIFKTIDAISQKNKSQAVGLLHKHLDNGDNPLYMLSMIAYQFKNLLIIKELAEKGAGYQVIVKKSGLHPFVVKKNYYLCQQFSMAQLKKIYQKIFQVDSDIKTGKIDPELALDMLVAEI